MFDEEGDDVFMATEDEGEAPIDNSSSSAVPVALETYEAEEELTPDVLENHSQTLSQPLSPFLIQYEQSVSRDAETIPLSQTEKEFGKLMLFLLNDTFRWSLITVILAIRTLAEAFRITPTANSSANLAYALFGNPHTAQDVTNVHTAQLRELKAHATITQLTKLFERFVSILDEDFKTCWKKDYPLYEAWKNRLPNEEESEDEEEQALARDREQRGQPVQRQQQRHELEKLLEMFLKTVSPCTRDHLESIMTDDSLLTKKVKVGSLPIGKGTAFQKDKLLKDAMCTMHAIVSTSFEVYKAMTRNLLVQYDLNNGLSMAYVLDALVACGMRVSEYVQNIELPKAPKFFLEAVATLNYYNYRVHGDKVMKPLYKLFPNGKMMPTHTFVELCSIDSFVRKEFDTKTITKFFKAHEVGAILSQVVRMLTPNAENVVDSSVKQYNPMSACNACYDGVILCKEPFDPDLLLTCGPTQLFLFPWEKLGSDSLFEYTETLPNGEVTRHHVGQFWPESIPTDILKTFLDVKTAELSLEKYKKKYTYDAKRFLHFYKGTNVVAFDGNCTQWKNNCPEQFQQWVKLKTLLESRRDFADCLVEKIKLEKASNQSIAFANHDPQNKTNKRQRVESLEQKATTTTTTQSKRNDDDELETEPPQRQNRSNIILPRTTRPPPPPTESYESKLKRALEQMDQYGMEVWMYENQELRKTEIPIRVSLAEITDEKQLLNARMQIQLDLDNVIRLMRVFCDRSATGPTEAPVNEEEKRKSGLLKKTTTKRKRKHEETNNATIEELWSDNSFKKNAWCGGFADQCVQNNNNNNKGEDEYGSDTVLDDWRWVRPELLKYEERSVRHMEPDVQSKSQDKECRVYFQTTGFTFYSDKRKLGCRMNCPPKEHPMSIVCLAQDKIMEGQRLIWEVRSQVIQDLSRTFFHNNADGQQRWLMLKGLARTGKSQFVHIQTTLFRAGRVGAFSNDIEVPFGFSELRENKDWVWGEDWTNQLRVDRGTFQNMVSSDMVQVAKKREHPTTIRWDKTGIITTNGFNKFLNDQNSVVRRVTIVEFPHPVDNPDTNLLAIAAGERILMFIREMLMRIFYREFVWTKTKDFTKTCHPYFRKTSANWESQVDPFANFMNNENHVLLGKEYKIPLDALKVAFRTFCQEQGYNREVDNIIKRFSEASYRDTAITRFKCYLTRAPVPLDHPCLKEHALKDMRVDINDWVIGCTVQKWHAQELKRDQMLNAVQQQAPTQPHAFDVTNEDL